jgi:hypothetical protein
LEKIKKAGVPLGEYVQGKIYRGITTGFNEAFVIDEETKKRLIREDKKSAEVIKPFLRGRDIKRYAIEDANLFLIYVPWESDTKKYSAIFKHLKRFKKQLSDRPEVVEGRFPWFAMSRYASDYWQEFAGPKIVSAVLMTEPLFAYDRGGHFTLDTCYLLPIKSTYPLAILNSKLCWWILSRLTNQVQNQYSKIQVNQLARFPIATATETQRRAIEERVEKILAAKKKNPNADTIQVEREIDEIVYEIYGLTEEERRIVEGKQSATPSNRLQAGAK